MTCVHYFTDIRVIEGVSSGQCVRCGVTHRWPSDIDLSIKAQELVAKMKKENHMADEQTGNSSTPPMDKALDYAMIAAAAQVDRPVKTCQQGEPGWGEYMHQAAVWLKAHSDDLIKCWRANGLDKTVEYWNIPRSTLICWLQRRRLMAVRAKGGYGRSRPIQPAPAFPPAAPAARSSRSPVPGSWQIIDATGDDLDAIIDQGTKTVFIVSTKRELAVLK